MKARLELNLVAFKLHVLSGYLNENTCYRAAGFISSELSLKLERGETVIVLIITMIITILPERGAAGPPLRS